MRYVRPPARLIAVPPDPANPHVPAVPADARRELACIHRLPALWLPRLPASATLVCWHPGLEQTLWVTTSREHYEAATAARVPVLHGDHWRSLTQATEEGKARLAVEQWLITRMPFSPVRESWLMHGTLESLIGPLERGRDLRDYPHQDLPLAHSHVTIGAVLEHFGLELQAIDPPPTIAPDARLL